MNSDIYVICSKSEAFPMTMLEAMSYGLPVISYDNLIGPSEVIKNKVNGQLVRKDSASEIAEEILNYYHNKKNLEVSSEGALKTAKEFDVQSICSKWKRII
jgi:glycosyltransferase involved in cell wall biosynthesis